MTFLTDGRIPISDDERKSKEKAYEKARVISWKIWFEAYKSGQLSLEYLLRNSERSLKILGVDDFLRWKTLGLLVESALKVSPPKRSRGNKGHPGALRSVVVGLVTIAHDDDGFVLTRIAKEQTAFERVAEILAELGISITPRQAEDWYYDRRD